MNNKPALEHWEHFVQKANGPSILKEYGGQPVLAVFLAITLK